MKKISFKDFLERAKKIHKDKYDYSLVEYKSFKIPIKIVCSKHGIQEISPSYHLQSCGCKKCGRENVNKERILTNKEIIRRFRKIHCNKYDYSLVDYQLKEKVKIICSKHGIFEQHVSNHLQGHDCIKCSEENRAKTLRELNKRKMKVMTNIEFVKKAREIHGDRYDYSLVNYICLSKKVIIICKQHGKFEQAPGNHLRGSSCQQCAFKGINSHNQQEFLEMSKKIHGSKYDYSSSIYNGSHNKVKINCKKHGTFEQVAYQHYQGSNCQKCACYGSKFAKEIFDFIKNNYSGKITENERSKIGYELDIYISKLKLAFELNGVYWHNELHKPKDYHLMKTELCEEKGIHLIHIYEDDWILRKEIIKSRIISLLKKSKRIYARKCSVIKLDNREKRIFLIENHLQGDVRSKINLGLVYNDNIVSVMTIGNRRLALGTKNSSGFELLRFCNLLNYSVIGGASKLFSYFLSNYNFESVISFADRSWTSIKENLYKNLHFNFLSKTKPNYYYVLDYKRYHRFGFRKDVLVKQGYDKNKTEREIMQERKIYRIYNSGNLKYEFSKMNL